MQDLATLKSLKQQHLQKKRQEQQRQQQQKPSLPKQPNGFTKIDQTSQKTNQQSEQISKLYNNIQKMSKAINQNIQDVGIVRNHYLDVEPTEGSSGSDEMLESRGLDFASLNQVQQIDVLHHEIAKMAQENTLLSEKIQQLYQTIKQDKLKIQQGQMREKIQQEKISIFAQQAQEINQLLGIAQNDEDFKGLIVQDSSIDQQSATPFNEISKDEEKTNLELMETYEREQSQQREKVNEKLKEQIEKLKQTMEELQTERSKTAETNKWLEQQTLQKQQEIEKLKKENEQLLKIQKYYETSVQQFKEEKQKLDQQNNQQVQQFKEQQQQHQQLQQKLKQMELEHQQLSLLNERQKQGYEQKIKELNDFISKTGQLLNISNTSKAEELKDAIKQRVSALQSKEQLEQHVKIDNPSDQLDIIGQKLDIQKDSLYNITKDAKNFMKKVKKLDLQSQEAIGQAKQLKAKTQDIHSKYLSLQNDKYQFNNYIQQAMQYLYQLTNDVYIDGNNKSIQVDDVLQQQKVVTLQMQLEEQKKMFTQLEQQIKISMPNQPGNEQLNIHDVIANITQNNTEYLNKLQENEEKIQHLQLLLQEKELKLQEVTCDHLPEQTLEQRLNKLASRIINHEKENQTILDSAKQLQSEIRRIDGYGNGSTDLNTAVQQLQSMQKQIDANKNKNEKIQGNFKKAIKHIYELQGKQYELATGIGIQVEDQSTNKELKELQTRIQRMMDFRRGIMICLQEICNQSQIQMPLSQEQTSTNQQSSENSSIGLNNHNYQAVKMRLTKNRKSQLFDNKNSVEARQFFSQNENKDNILESFNQQQFIQDDIDGYIHKMLDNISEWCIQSYNNLQAEKQTHNEKKSEIDQLKKELEQLKTLFNIEHMLTTQSMTGSMGESGPQQSTEGQGTNEDQILHENNKIMQKLQKYLNPNQNPGIQGQYQNVEYQEKNLLNNENFQSTQKELEKQVKDLNSKSTDEKEKIIYQQIQQYQHLLNNVNNKHSDHYYTGNILNGDNTFTIFTHKKENSLNWPLQIDQSVFLQYNAELYNNFNNMRTFIIQKIQTCMQTISISTIDNGDKFQLLEILQDIINSLKNYKFDAIPNLN